jgi:phospho-N-acetylmuramoyl-pentapeptide-transferase
VKGVLISGAVALIAALLGTPMFIRFLVKRGYGQFIRDDGPTSHHTKRGTPTMGGAIILGAVLVAYLAAHVATLQMPTMSALLVLFLMTGLGIIGFLDDFIKISKQRSLGLRSKQKLAGQVAIGVVFAVLALNFRNDQFRTPASPFISFVRDTHINLAFAGTIGGVLLFVIWANLMIAGTSNGVNLTDRLDGLAAGVSTMVLGAYVLIGIWTQNQNCQTNPGIKCYEVRDSLDLAVVAAAGMGS